MSALFGNNNFLDSLPPDTNRGGTSPASDTSPTALKELAIIDTLRFTFKNEEFEKEFNPDNDIVISRLSLPEKVSAILTGVLGFGISSKNERGRDFYNSCYLLGNNWGYFCTGGEHQRETSLVVLNGGGCLAGLDGWEKRLYDFLIKVKAKITRVDIAADLVNGEYSVEKARADHLAGLFKVLNSPVNPRGQMAGCWDFEALGISNTGRTYYVGEREHSSKFFRIYEKGLQMAKKLKDVKGFENADKWIRVELELKSKDVEIPYGVLLTPSAFIAGSVPALSFLSEAQERIITKKKTIKANIENAVKNIRKMWGAWLYLLRFYFDDDEKLLNAISKRNFPENFSFFDVADSENMDFTYYRAST